MNFKILVIIGVAISIAIILLVNYSFTKPETSQESSEVVTKGSITGANNSALSGNYTSLELLSYCSENENRIYDDTCIRGLWDVADSCKNANFTSNNNICGDPRLDRFEIKVTNEMQDLDKSLTQTIDSCMISKNNDDIQSCLVTIDRIKNDCTDPHFYSLTHICTDPRLDQFTQKYNETP